MSDISIDEAIKPLKLTNGLEKQEIYVHHELNIDKVKNLDDCKKVLKFLCGLSIKPLQDGIEYSGFSDVEQYFD